MKRITVLLADDHTLVREGLRVLLQAERDIEVVGEAASGREAVDLAQRLLPAVIIMDVVMPQLNGLEAARQIRRNHPEIKLLLLSGHGDIKYVEAGLALGVHGYIAKQDSSRHLIAAVRDVLRGKTFFEPVYTACRKNRFDPNFKLCRNCADKRACMTAREVEVLQLVAEGRANKQIAAELRISIKTVEKHRGSLSRKLDLHDTASLTRYAISSGLVDNTPFLRKPS